MKRILIIIISALVLILTIVLMQMRINALNETIDTQSANIKAYECELDTQNSNAMLYKFTIAQMQNSRDTLMHHLDSIRHELKIKDKRLKSMSYVQSTLTKYDTIYINQTLWQTHQLDTVIGDAWFNTHININDTLMNVDSKFTSKLSVFTSTKRETVNPPSKIFFIRWFQRKHNVITIDVVEENPHVTIEKQKFVEIIK